MTAVATCMTTVVAIVTAWLVLGQLKAAGGQLAAAREAQDQARQAEKEMERPYVVASVQSSEAAAHLLDLVIENLGKTPAKNVRVRIDPPPLRGMEQAGLELANAKALTEPIPLIPPGRVIRIFFDDHRDRDGKDLPTSYVAYVAYRNSAGESWEEEYVLDLDTLRGAMFVNVHGLHDLARAVQSVDKTLAGASILRRNGEVRAHAIVESKDEHGRRMADEARQATDNHRRIVEQVLPHRGKEDGAD